MRLTIIIMTTLLMQLSASTRAQKVTLDLKNASLVTVLASVKAQTGYQFLYPSQLKERSKVVNIQIKDMDLLQALEVCFANQPFEYSLEEKTIIIKEKEPSLLDQAKSALDRVIQNGLVIQSAAKDLRGRVLDQDGKPLPNASIRVKGKNTVTNTNADGEFEIKGVADDAVLLVSYVGFKTLEIPLKDAVMPLEIKLNVATGELEEVKVVYNTGYQELNKERATGSFVYIDNELFNRRVGATVLDRISDLVPGLLTARSTAKSLEEITIRGVSTINASKLPLLVVDNFIFEGDINSINPNDIESVTVLKDAAAASIWGVRAGNGVIVLTTKKGKYNQRSRISFNSNITIKEKPDYYSIPAVPSKDIVSLEKSRYAKGYYTSNLNNTTSYPVIPMVVEILEKQKSGGISELEAEALIEQLQNHDIRDDINRYLLQSQINQQYSLNLSGGTDTYRYSTSTGYDKSRNNEVNNQNDRLTLRFNSSWNPIKNLELNVDLSWGQSKSNSKNSLGPISNVLTSPYLKLADENGRALAIPKDFRLGYVDNLNEQGLLDWHYRPLDETNNGNKKSQENNTRIAGSIKYNILSGLKVDLSYQWQKSLTEDIKIYDLGTYINRSVINRYSNISATTGLPIYPIPLGAQYSYGNTNLTSWNIRGGVNYNRNWTHHRINAIGGIERRQLETEGFNSPTLYGFDPQTYTFGVVQYGSWKIRPNGSTSVLAPETGSARGLLNRFGSYFANAAYSYDDRYTISASGRVDESNFFGLKANARKTPLWSAGVSWDLSKESFYHLSCLPSLQLRLTYGFNGNTNPGTSPLATARYNDPGQPLLTRFATIVTSPNPQLRWERVENVNIGVTFIGKNQRIMGTLEIYQKRSLDLISGISIDPTSGFVTYTGNNASMKGKGLDVSLNTKNLVGTLKWQTNLIFSYNQEKVTAYSVPSPTTGSGYLQPNAIIIDMPVNKLYSYKWAGLNPLNGDSRIYINGQIMNSIDDLKAKPEDMIYNGRTSPSIFGAFRNDFSWNNFSTSVNIGYMFGYYFRRNSFNGEISNTISFVHNDYLKAWQKPGDENATDVPGFLDSYPDNRYIVYQSSDNLIEKGDHIRLQDVRVNYSITKSRIKGLPFTGMSIYTYINNLGVLWRSNKYNLDPETVSFGSIPVARTIAFGLVINL